MVERLTDRQFQLERLRAEGQPLCGECRNNQEHLERVVEDGGEPTLTDKMLSWLEEASKHKPQWEMSKRFILNSKIWQDNLRQAGIDLTRVKERIREIDFEKNEDKHLP